MLAPELRTLEEHEAALANPDLVRPSPCLRCGVAHVHVRERRNRVSRGEVDGPPGTEILIFRCADPENCGALWRVLPAGVSGPASVEALVRRWCQRAQTPCRPSPGYSAHATALATSAAVLLALLGATGLERGTGLAPRIGATGSRGD